MKTILSASADSSLASEDPVLAAHQIVAAGVILCKLVVVRELDAALRDGCALCRKPCTT